MNIVNNFGVMNLTISMKWTNRFKTQITKTDSKRNEIYGQFHIYERNAAAKLLQSCLTLCDPIGGSPSGSLVPGILQARILEWVAVSFSNA